MGDPQEHCPEGERVSGVSFKVEPELGEAMLSTSSSCIEVCDRQLAQIAQTSSRMERHIGQIAKEISTISYVSLQFARHSTDASRMNGSMRGQPLSATTAFSKLNSNCTRERV